MQYCTEKLLLIAVPNPYFLQGLFLMKYLLLFSFIFCTATLFAQKDSLFIARDSVVAVTRTDTTFGRRLVYDLKNIAGGVLYTYERPLHWRKENLPAIGAFVGGTALLFFADDDASRYFKDQGKKVPVELHHLGFYMGKPQYNYTATAAIYLAGLISKNEKLRRTGVLIISSATAGAFLQTFTKSAAGRTRPSMGYGNTHFKPFASGPGYHSFPSGHTILSTTAFYAISKQFSNPWAKAGILAVGLITPASRLWDNAHWLSDVGLGVGISIVTVEAVDHFLKKNEKYEADRVKDPKQTKISWNFRAGYNQIGFVGVF